MDYIGELCMSPKPPGYLQWMLDRKMEEGAQDEDWIHTLQYYLKG